jgi:hypothetical protein
LIGKNSIPSCQRYVVIQHCSVPKYESLRCCHGTSSWWVNVKVIIIKTYLIDSIQKYCNQIYSTKLWRESDDMYTKIYPNHWYKLFRHYKTILDFVFPKIWCNQIYLFGARENLLCYIAHCVLNIFEEFGRKIFYRLLAFQWERIMQHCLSLCFWVWLSTSKGLRLTTVGLNL